MVSLAHVKLAAVSVVLLAACGVSAFRINEPFLTPERVASINALGSEITWTASADQGRFFFGANEEQVKALLGVRRNGFKLPRRTYEGTGLEQSLPTNFDASEKWGSCPSITTIRDQSSCGSCWAFGAAEAISDRYCTYGVTNVSISANDLVACCSDCGDGCNGGNPASAWDYWVHSGLVDTTCDPYPFQPCEHHIPAGRYPTCPSKIYPTPKCVKKCNASSTSWKSSLHFGSDSWSLSGEKDFMAEVYNHGPFEVALDVYSDFPSYKSGVYHKTKGATLLGGHAVRLVGWGVLNGTKYWKIANSWNEDWGMGGYFLIRRGNDECGIEDEGSAGSPKKKAE